MGTVQSEVQVLIQELDGSHARWWSEDTGAALLGSAMELRVPVDRGAACAARHLTTDRARDFGATPEALPLITLLTSELVTNAVLHSGGTHVEVRAWTDLAFITVEVSDAGTELRSPQSTGADVPGGHGMRLVDMLAARWGARVHPDGRSKTVWFNVALA